MDPEIKADIERRTPDGWYGLASPRGWDDLVSELHLKLVELHPNYKVYQIKEKFGGLRYYTDISAYELDEDNEPIMGDDGKYVLSEAYQIISTYEARSLHVCEKCGLEGPTVCLWGSGWIRTFCVTCGKDSGKEPAGWRTRKLLGYPPIEEDEDEDDEA